MINLHCVFEMSQIRPLYSSFYYLIIYWKIFLIKKKGSGESKIDNILNFHGATKQSKTRNIECFTYK